MKLVSGVMLVLGLVGIVTSGYFLAGAVGLGQIILLVIGLLISLWFTAAGLMTMVALTKGKSLVSEMFKMIK